MPLPLSRELLVLRHFFPCLLVWLTLIGLLLVGCGKSGPPLREDVDLDLLFTATRDINPNAKGRPSPLAVRYFFLAATDTFDESDYFSLQSEPKTVLDTELLPGGKNFVIRPGARRRIQQVAPPGITAIGIIAGYRDLGNATWKIVHMVPVAPEVGMFSSSLKVRLTIELSESDINLQERKKN